ncbi:fucose isomerase [Coraliomargarita sinensis]|uniref:Fucose isomerase n=1 Tax=Coraliomargarita sinensis TaxID=2174842 RepID=A0A317ZFR2_9BACT|nr:fucose isomerase [Coraliomargarita sinensis]PXA03167.1 fucose isomerase [Coraliomargarita sinensis]
MAKAKQKTVLLVANGDLRLSANQNCWAKQDEMEKELASVVAELGAKIKRAHPYKPDEKHGFIASQREGMDVFAKIDRKAPIIIAEAVWQYSHHLLHGLISHQGPILTVANWSGTWPGLVGMLNLNGSLTKASVKYSTLWSENFGSDKSFQKKLRKWLETGEVTHRTGHVKKYKSKSAPAKTKKVAAKIAADLDKNKAIMGVFDEFCMGMYNAAIPDELLFQTGVFKEQLSQSALFAEMQTVTQKEAEEVYGWIKKKGFNFHFGRNGKTGLIKAQVIEQCKMYIAACRIGDRFGCDAIGIQYQQGLKDLCPASDLVEGMLNSTDRPPVKNAEGKIILKGETFPHFNEVDECCGLDALLTKRLHTALKQPVETTLHDIRWGDWDQSGTTKDYVWVFLISGSAPVEHHVGGWKGSHGYRQPAMYFPKGGSTLHGIAKPGEIVWSRIFIEDGKLKMDLGRAKVIELPKEETERRLNETTPQWPIMHAVTYGVSRDQMMARHKANHINVAYAHSAKDADKCLYAKAELAKQLGMEVSLCGTDAKGKLL